MVAQAPAPLSAPEAKARLLALGEARERGRAGAPLVLAGAAAALVLGMIVARRRSGSGPRLASLALLAASPAARALVTTAVSAGVRALLARRAR